MWKRGKMKTKEPMVVNVYIRPSKKLTPSDESVEVYNKMMSDRIMQESRKWTEYWREKASRQEEIKEILLKKSQMSENV